MTDRREATRFPVSEDVKYTVVRASALPMTCIGKTLNLGRGGLLLSTPERLPLGQRVELAVAWPARRDGECLLQFAATGQVVWSECDRAAVKFEHHEFRTRGVATDRPLAIVGAPST
jgi:hypothetical protein